MSGPTQPASQARVTTDIGQLSRILQTYRAPNTRRGIFDLLVTALPLALLWLLMGLALQQGFFWLYIVMVIPAAGFLLRLFMIQHDCGHGSFFRWRRMNDWTGRAIGVLTLTPYGYWRRTHAAHHAGAGNLDRRGDGDVETLTVREYQELSHLRKLRYRLYRNPLVMFGLGPFYIFFLQYRLPLGLMRAGWRPWLSVMGTNIAICAAAAASIWLVGVSQFLLLYVLVALIASSVGVWLFYVQHQFEETSWARDADWNAQEMAVHGSSYYDLPPLLRWFTANIGAHHVHHLASRIPSYRLAEVLNDHPVLTQLSRVTLSDSLRCIRLVLWDEKRARLISFEEIESA